MEGADRLRPLSPYRFFLLNIFSRGDEREVHVSRVERGAEADITVLLHSGLLEQANQDRRIIGDMGYRGPYGVIIPASRKRRRSTELQRLEEERPNVMSSRQKGQPLGMSTRTSG